MSKKMSLRILAGFLAFIMVFFSINDYSVFAANNTEQTIVADDENQDTASVDAEDVEDAACINEVQETVTVSSNDSDVEDQQDADEADESDDVEIEDEEVDPVNATEALTFTETTTGGKWTATLPKKSGSGTEADQLIATWVSAESKIIFASDSRIQEIPALFDCYGNNGTLKTKLDGIRNAVVEVELPKNTSSTINNGIVSIAAKAFYDCNKLVSINLKDCVYTDNGGQIGLRDIGASAFEGCSSLGNTDVASKKFDLGTTVQRIFSKAFSTCTSIEELTLPASLTTIDTAAFSGCTKLKLVRDQIPNLSAKTAFAKGIFASCKIKEIVFEGTETIPNGLFYQAGFDEEATIKIPSNIEIIDENAFRESNIKSIDFSKATELSKIGDGAFRKCEKLGNVTFPNSLTTIGNYAFAECKFTVIDLDRNGQNKITTLGEGAFYMCGNVTSLKLSGTVSTMGKYVFQKCIGLTSVKIPISKIGDYAFSSCTSLSSIEMTDAVTKIGEYAFDSCSALTKVTIPCNVESIGTRGFAVCTNLKEVVINKTAAGTYNKAFTTIGNSAFYGCINLSKFNSDVDKVINIPSCITSIGEFAFDYEHNSDSTLGTINTIILSDTVEKIGQYAFYNHPLVRSITLPKNVYQVGQYAFAVKNAVGGNLETINVESQRLDDKNVKFEVNIFLNAKINKITFAEGVPAIPSKMFSGASFNLNELQIPSTVKTIGSSVFAGVNIPKITIAADSTGVYHLEKIGEKAFMNNTLLESFEIPVSVTDIGTSAFENCSRLQGVKIPENVLTLGNYVWKDCANLGDVYFNVIAYKSCGSGLFANSKLYNAYLGPKVTKIPAGLFANAVFVEKATGEEALVTLVIPDSMKELPKQALVNIKNLGGIIFASDEAFTKLGEQAFGGCTNLKNIIVNSEVKYDEAQGLYLRDESKDKIGLPASITEIGVNAFTGCTKLEEIKIPESCTKILNGAFSGCSGLKKVVISEKVETIGEGAFKDCVALTDIVFEGNNVSTLSPNVFDGCAALTGLFDVRAGVQKIGTKAFRNCTGITEIDLPTSITDISADAFQGCDSLVKFYALKDSVAYKWLNDNGYGNMIEEKYPITYMGLEEGDINNNDGSYRVNEDMPLIPAVREGYTFLGWYTDQAMTMKVESTKGLTGPLTLYSKWEATVFAVNYDLNEGVNDPKNPQTVDYNRDLVLYPASKPGCGFTSWVLLNEEVDKETGEVIKVTEKEIKKKTDKDGVTTWVVPNVKADLKVRAKWKAYNYSITYNLNGGVVRSDKYKNDIKSISVKGDQEVTLASSQVAKKLNKKKKEAFALVEWNTKADGTGKSYGCGEVVKNIATKDNEKITLYAIWAEDYFFIQYMPNGSKASISANMIKKVPFSLSHDKALYSEKNISRPGFKFLGWSRKAKGDVVYKPGQVINGATEFGEGKFKKTIKLYAQWEAIDYTITYETNEGTLTSSAKTSFTAKKAYTFKKPKRAGYKFKGWYTTPDFTGKKVKSTKGIYKNITLYAKWEAK